MSLLLSTPGKQIKDTSISEIFTTFTQLMYKVFRDMRKIMFPSKEIRRFLPRVFKTIKGIRCSVNCTEFRVETSRNFTRQGNTYSSYKHANTFKCLIAVTPNGGSCFVSDLYEGDIPDVQIFGHSCCSKFWTEWHFKARWTTRCYSSGQGIYCPRSGSPSLSIYPNSCFFERKRQPKCSWGTCTRKIAKARAHVERFNQRLKQFKLVGRTIPLSLAPLATQMAVVACGLVNFQQVLCK